jgi:hypothetical protein
MAAMPDTVLPQQPGGGAPGGDTELAPAVKRQLKLEEFAGVLIGKRTEAVQGRSASGVERRWTEDLDAYHGRDAFNRPQGILEIASPGGAVGEDRAGAAKTGPQSGARSTLYVQLSRQKTNTAAARVQEMLFPSDEPNWSIAPTPVPQLLNAITEHAALPIMNPQSGQPLPHPDKEGQPLTAGDVAAERMRKAQKACEAMSKQVADRLEECNYVGHGRQVIMDAAQLGTGIIRGPVVVNSIEKAWQQHKDATGSVRVLQMRQQRRPASYRVSPWDFFPDPACGESIQEGSYVWEREFASPRKLRDLARTPGYSREAIGMCLQEGPRRVTTAGTSHYEQARAGDGYGATTVRAWADSRYELWTFVGECDREDLEAIGIKVPEEQADLYSLSAIVVMCNDRIIKAALNPMDGADLPYDVFVWERVSLSPWGVGIPYLMRYAQRTINAAWRAMLDNMGASSGVQIIMSEDIVPADGNWQITGRKIWRAPKGVDVDKAFRTFEIPSRQAELTNVIRLAMEFADAETALPQIAQGEQGTAPETVGGMTLLMNAANTVLKRLARQFDELVTKPHIRRYYDWEMQFNPDDAIKGDFSVAARGSSALVERDVRTQSITEVVAAATHPVFGMFLDQKKLFRTYLESKKVSPDSVMKSDDEIAQAQQAAAQAGPQKTPQEKVAEIRAQADIAKIKVDTESEATNERLRQENAQRDRDHDELMQLLAYRTKALEVAKDQGMSLLDLQKQLSMFVMEKRFEERQSDLDRQMQITQGSDQRTHDANKEAFRASQKPATAE